MSNFQLNYTHPWLLLLIVPALLFTLVPYFRMARKYRRTRNRIISMTLHLIAMVLAINLLAGVSFAYDEPNDENEVIILVDVSESNADAVEKKEDFLQTILNISDGKYRVGIVKYAYGQVYAAPFTTDTEQAYELYKLSDNPDVTATDLASALKFAAELFEHPESGKIVIVSDGIETDKNATSVIKSIASSGIRVDTAYFANKSRNDFQITDVSIPEQKMAVGEPISLEITVQHNLGTGEKPLTVRLYDNGNQLGEDGSVIITKTTQILPVTVTLDDYGMHELCFEIEYEQDSQIKNNTYRTYVNLQLFDKILLIENKEGESEKLGELLSEQFDLTSISIENDLDKMPKTLRELAEYEQVVLVNVAYRDMPTGFEAMLHEYVSELGGALFTVGGENDVNPETGKPLPHSYNRDDIANSIYLKQMLPVNVVDYTPPIAVMLVIDTSASMGEEGKLQAAIDGAKACLDALSDRDYCGVMSFETEASEILQVLPVSQKDVIRQSIENIKPDSASGGTVYSHAINLAGLALGTVEKVERKHIIIVSDGMPGDSYEEYLPYIQQNVGKDITMSVVAINAGANYVQQLEDTAAAGNGGFYNIPLNDVGKLAEVIPQDVAQKAVGEIEDGKEFFIKIKDKIPALDGILESDLPPLTGYYGTMLKEDAVAPLAGAVAPIYAQWKYGNGNVGSFLSELNGVWSADFIASEVGKTVIVNIVANLFPTDDVTADNIDYVVKTDNYTTQVNVHSITEGHRVNLSVTPVTEELSEIYPDGIPVNTLEESRRFTFEAKKAGLYRITLTELDGEGLTVATTVTYMSFSYSQEYNAFPDREPIGAELMALLAEDGKGAVINDPAEVFFTFNESIRRNIDPRVVFLILVIILLLLDIAVRKFKFKWPWELVREYRQRRADGASRGK